MIITCVPFLSFKNDGKLAVVLEDLEKRGVCICIGVLSGKTSVASIFTSKWFNWPILQES